MLGVLLSATLFDGSAEVLVFEIDEEEEGTVAGKLLAHVEHGDGGGEEEKRGGGALGFGGCELVEAESVGVIADEVVVLDGADEGFEVDAIRLSPAGHADLRGEEGGLEDVAAGEGEFEIVGRVLAGGAVLVRSELGEDAVKEVVAPEGGHLAAALVEWSEQFGVEDVALGNEVDLALKAGAEIGHAGSDVVGDVRLGFVGDAVDGVEAQAVEVEVLDPVADVFEDPGAGDAGVVSVEIGSIAPRCPMLVRDVAAEVVEVVPLGAEVVVNHVEDDRDATSVGCGDEVAQRFRAAQCVLRREEMDAVVTPVPATPALGERHEFDGGDAEVHEFIESCDGGGVTAFVGEGAEVELVDDEVRFGQALPGGVTAGEISWIDQLRLAVRSVGLESTAGVGSAFTERKLEGVAVAMLCGDSERKVTFVAALHRFRRMSFEAEADGRTLGCPEVEGDGAVGMELGADVFFHFKMRMADKVCR